MEAVVSFVGLVYHVLNSPGTATIVMIDCALPHTYTLA